MEDLISRKALIRRLFYAKDGSKYPTRDCDNFQLTVGLEDLRKYIHKIPTAFNVDRVVEQLEKEFKKYYGDNWDKAPYLVKAIEIVKGGGQGE